MRGYTEVVVNGWRLSVWSEAYVDGRDECGSPVFEERVFVSARPPEAMIGRGDEFEWDYAHFFDFAFERRVGGYSDEFDGEYVPRRTITRPRAEAESLAEAFLARVAAEAGPGWSPLASDRWARWQPIMGTVAADDYDAAMDREHDARVSDFARAYPGVRGF